MRTRTIIGLSVGFIVALFLLGILPLLAQDGPSFSIIKPLTNERVSGTTLPIAIEFNCDESAPVVRFEAYIDSTSLVWGRIRKPISQGHFRVEGDLDSVSLKPGKHTLYVKLFDSQGRVTQCEQPIILEAPNTLRSETNPPRVRIVSPKDGQVMTDNNAEIKVDASDDSGIKLVEIYINNKMRAYMNEAPFTLPWNPISEANTKTGSIFIIRARALDLFDNEGNSLPVTVRVLPALTTIESSGEASYTLLDETRSLFPSSGVSADKYVLLADNFVRPTPAMPEVTGDVPLSHLWDRGALQSDTGQVVALLPVKTLPGQTLMDMASGAQNFNPATPVALAALPGALSRPLLVDAPFTASRGELLTPPALDSTPRALAEPILVALLPVTATKLAPSSAQEAADAGITGSASVTPLRVFNPTAARQPIENGRIAMPVTDTAGLPSATFPTEKAYQAERILVALAPTTASKLRPGIFLPVAVVPMSDGQTITLLQPLAGDICSRPTLTPEWTSAPCMLPQAFAVEKVGERGNLDIQPVVVTLLPATMKHAPASPALTPVVDAVGAAVQSPRMQDDAQAARATNATNLPRLASADLTVTVAMNGAPRADVQPTSGTPKFTPAAKSTPAHAATGEVGLANGVSQQTAPQMTTDAAHPAPWSSSFTVRPDANPATLDAPAAPDRRLPSETAPVRVAGLPGKVAPEAGAEQPTTLAPGNTTRNAAPSTDIARPATTVTRPTPAESELYVDYQGRYAVKRDDVTLVEIARLYHTTPDELVKLNPGITPDTRPLPVGATLVVPKESARIYLDDAPVTGGPNPFLAQGHTMVPMRGIIEAKGGVVVWLPSTHEVNAWADNTYMGVKIGAQEARINGESFALPVAPEIRQSRTMVPLRYLMTALRLQVAYNPKTGTYYLMSQAGN